MSRFDTCTGTDDDAPVVTFSADLAGAWPDQAGLRSWRRTVSLDRDAGTVVVTDDWDVAELTNLELPLVLAVEPVITTGHLGVGGLTADVSGFTTRVERQPIAEADRLRPTWGECVWRLVLTPRVLAAQGSWELRFVRGSTGGVIGCAGDHGRRDEPVT